MRCETQDGATTGVVIHKQKGPGARKSIRPQANDKQYTLKGRYRLMLPRDKYRGLTQSRLKEILSYDPTTGVFTSRKSMGKRKAGSIAGSVKKTGYCTIEIDGFRYQAHRVAWLYVYGEWPTQFLDHIDGDRSNNKICNLRQAGYELNLQNLVRPRKNNKLGVLGVSIYGDKFRANIWKDNKSIYIGAFETQEAAHAAYVAAKRTLHAGCTL